MKQKSKTKSETNNSEINRMGQIVQERELKSNKDVGNGPSASQLERLKVNLFFNLK